MGLADVPAPEWGGIAKLAFAFRERYEPELPYLEQMLSPG